MDTKRSSALRSFFWLLVRADTIRPRYGSRL